MKLKLEKLANDFIKYLNLYDKIFFIIYLEI